MIVSVAAALIGALVFGAAGICGALAGIAIVPTIQPFEDGPAPVKVNPFFLVVGAAFLGAIVGFQHVPLASFVVAAFATIPLVAIWYCDARTGIVPDLFTIVPLAIVMIYAFMLHELLVPVSALVVFIPFAILAIASKGNGMGWGDAKLGALGGALVGMYAGTALFAIATLVAVVVTAIRYRSTKARIALAPYLCAATAVGIALHLR